MGRSTTLVLVLVLAAVLGLFLVQRGGAQRGAPVTTERPVETGLAAQPAPVDPPVDADPRRSSLVTPEAEPSAPLPEGPTPAGPPAAETLVTLNGAAVRVDGAGAEHAGDDGGFTLGWRRGALHAAQEIEVLGGRWAAEVPADARLYLRDLILDAAPLWLEERERLVPPDHFLLLRGIERRAIRLHVLSARDGSPLDDIEVWPGPQSFPTAIQHPGAQPEGQAVARNARSPVTIPPRADAFRNDSQYFVRAPGHAWGSIAVDHAQGGERTLQLEPAARLTVELIGNATWLDPLVRLWPPDASPYAAYPIAQRKPDTDDLALFEALPPGTYRVSVERGWADRRESYASTILVLAEGEDARVSLHIALPEEPVAVRVSGTLEIAAGWDASQAELAFGGEGQAEKWLTEELKLDASDMQPGKANGAAAAGSTHLAWSVDLPCAGGYRVEVYPFVVRRFLDVPPTGLEGVQLVVASPAQVEVRVVEEASRAELFPESLRWGNPPIAEIIGTPVYTANADPHSGRVRFRAPAGWLRIYPSDYSLVPVTDEERFEVLPGPNAIELVVRRQFSVSFRFMDGDATLPWERAWRLGALRADGAARDVARGRGILWFAEPGTYALTSQGIPGYHSIDGTRFEVRAGAAELEVVVPLVRE